jgi:hypothetical protein
MNVTGREEIITNARKAYGAYDEKVWSKAYFDEYSGGYNVYHKNHQFAKKGGGGDAEKEVGVLLAKYNGKQVEFLPERTKKSPDVLFDGKTWDIKYIEKASEHTVRDYIRDARKADNAIFYFLDGNKYAVLESAVLRETGRFIKNGRINELPDIYYINNERILKRLWSKEGLNK